MEGLTLNLPITELENEITNAIDIVSPVGIVRTLCSSDAQIFSGWKALPSIYDFTEKFTKICKHACDLIQLSQTEGIYYESKPKLKLKIPQLLSVALVRVGD